MTSTGVAQAFRVASLAIVIAACGDDSGDGAAPDASVVDASTVDANTTDASAMDAALEPSGPTTGAECFAGLQPSAGVHYVEIQHFVSDDGRTRVWRARQPEPPSSERGTTEPYGLVRAWIDSDLDDGTCIRDRQALTYEYAHHNWDEHWTVTTPRARYSGREWVEVSTSGLSPWMQTLEAHDAAGAVLLEPLALIEDGCESIPGFVGACPDRMVIGEPPEVDAGPDESWLGCPSATDFVGPSGEPTLYVADDATYCVGFDESKSFQEARAAKAKIRFAPGEYALGTTTGAEIRLPVCTRMQSATEPVAVLAAPLAYSIEEVDSGDLHHFSLRAPIEQAGNAELGLQLDIAASAGEPPSMWLTGQDNGDANRRFAFQLCTDGAACANPLKIYSCTFEAWPLHHHVVSFAGGGRIELSLRLGYAEAGTQPGAFVGGWGSWSGQNFVQLDYFKLLYVPSHHHLKRSFIVLFDEPIDGACGLRVSDLDPLDSSSGSAATIDCELQDLNDVAISAHEHRIR